MDNVKKLWLLAFPVAYIVIGLIVGCIVASNDGGTPILSGLLWPIPVVRAMFGNGPLVGG